ncbi:UNVERIFIED_CONTAM: hypothetical protein RMT77_014378 [Armadillidium vulgare]
MPDLKEEEKTPNLKEVSVEVVNYDDSPTEEKRKSSIRKEILYSTNEIPPWHLCILLGIQHFFIMVGSTLPIPYFLTPLLCLQDDDPSRGQIISSIFFVSGIVTMLQTTFGCRLPIVQGGTFAFLLPTMAILTTSFDSCQTYDFANMTTADKDDIWMTRIRAIQGAIIISSITQVLIGLTGIVGYIASWITPLTIVPTVTLVGLSLFRPATDKAATHWGISIMTASLLILFSQYISELGIPLPSWRGKKLLLKKFKIFKFFPIICAIFISWGICGILTAFEVFPEDSEARTDSKISLIRNSRWFYVPYPFQWGLPTISASGVIGMIAGVLGSTAESIGDYYACSRLTESGPLPEHAVNRGIFIEGIGCIIAGIIGTGNGTTSYSDNIAALRLTKVASRRVIQVAAILMLICGICTKFTSIFISVPNPVVGGVFIIMFGVIASIGLSNLQVIDLNSSRNIFILGVSLFIGLAIPEWLENNPGSIETGSPVFSQVLVVLLNTRMFVGGAVGFFLDNTIPGTPEERGLTKWNKINFESESDERKKETSVCDPSVHDPSVYDHSVYDLPFGMKFLRRHKIFSFIPISPTYKARKS